MARWWGVETESCVRGTLEAPLLWVRCQKHTMINLLKANLKETAQVSS